MKGTFPGVPVMRITGGSIYGVPVLGDVFRRHQGDRLIDVSKYWGKTWDGFGDSAESTSNL